MDRQIESAREGLIYHLRRELNLNKVPLDEKSSFSVVHMPAMQGVDQEQIINAADRFDSYCRPCEVGHATRTTIYLGKMAYALRMPPEQATFLMALGAYHDGGKESLQHLRFKEELTPQEIEEIRQVHVGPKYIHSMDFRFGNEFSSSIENSHVSEGYPRELVIPMTSESKYASILLEVADKVEAAMSRKSRETGEFISFDKAIEDTRAVFEQHPRRVEYDGAFFPSRDLMTALGLVGWGVLNHVFTKPQTRKFGIFRRSEEEIRLNPWG